MSVLETDRLRLRRLTTADAPLMVALLNDPEFLRFVGDRQVRTEADARRYLANGPLASYARDGFGPYAVELKGDGEADRTPIGICGLFKRERLPHPDIGFAFLRAWRGMGFAAEAAGAVLEEARTTLGLARVLAIVDPANARSLALLVRLGLRELEELPGENGATLACYAIDIAPAAGAGHAAARVAD